MNETPTILGVETEYAIAPRSPNSGLAPFVPMPFCLIDPDQRLESLLRSLKSRHPHLVGKRPGIFLENGARVYFDRGHPEFATPEASDPLEAAVYVLAGAQIIKEALDAADWRVATPTEIARPELALFNINLDYAEENCANWGCHENIGTTGAAHVVRRAILPHLSSRVILTGAGGFNPYRPLAYVVSPRGLMMPKALDRNPEDVLFHMRREPYSNGAVDRLHIISGESLCSHLGIYLKLGTTALLVWLAQRGHEISAAYRPYNSHSALQAFSEDLTGFVRVTCVSGDRRSALEIQRALLEMAESAVEIHSPGDWAIGVLTAWRNALNSYALQGQIGLQRSFDWAIKWGVFDAHCRTFGISFQKLLAWDHTLTRLREASPEFRAVLSQPKRAFSLVRAELHKFRPMLGSRSIHELELVLRLRLQLRELDWRFCQVGDGVFEELRRRGVLRQDVPGLTPQRISDAMRIAPRQTRAWVRADHITRLHGSRKAANARCDWHVIEDPDRNRRLDMNDPRSTAEHWRILTLAREFALDPFQRAIELYEKCEYHQADAAFRRLRNSVRWGEIDPTLVDSYPFRLLRYSAWVRSRLGLLDGMDYLVKAYGNQTPANAKWHKISDQLYRYRFLGLVPHLTMDRLIGPALRILRADVAQPESSQASVREHLGAWALARGWLDQVEPLIGRTRLETNTSRRTRILCTLADAQRRSGRPDAARELLESARQGLSDSDVLMAEQIAPMRAKLEPDWQRRSALLGPAAERLYQSRHYMALCRVVLLRARNCVDGDMARALRGQFRKCRRAARVLATCPLATRIAMNWRAWTQSFEPDDTGDLYWGL